MTSLHIPVDAAEEGLIRILERVHAELGLIDHFRKLICSDQQEMRKEIEADLAQLRAARQEQEEIKAELLERFAQRQLNKQEYDAGMNRAKMKRAKITLQESNCRASLVPLDYLLDRAVMALEHLDVTWKTASETDKHALATTLFPDGFSCDKKGHVGTPADAHQFGLLTLLDTPAGELATPTGLEPVLPA